MGSSSRECYGTRIPSVCLKTLTLQILIYWQFCKTVNSTKTHFGGKTVRRWLKDIKEKKKEETRVHNAQVHAVISVAGVASAVVAVAAATATSSGSGESSQSKTSMAVASILTQN